MNDKLPLPLQISNGYRQNFTATFSPTFLMKPAGYVDSLSLGPSVSPQAHGLQPKYDVNQFFHPYNVRNNLLDHPCRELITIRRLRVG